MVSVLVFNLGLLVTLLRLDATALLVGLFGGEDHSIPTTKSVRALVPLAQVGRPVTWRTFEGYGHLLIGRNGAFLPRVAPESWPVLLNWLAKEGADSVP